MKDVVALLNTKRAELLDGIARIDAAIAALGEPSGSSEKAAKGTRKRRKRSEEERQATSERMKKYWAERRKQSTAAESGDAGAHAE